MRPAQALPENHVEPAGGGLPAASRVTAGASAAAPAGALRDPLPADPHAALTAVRERTRALVAGLTREQLERQVDPLMSPLVWDLAHIAAYEDLWLVHRHGGRPLLRPDLADLYDAFETPRTVRGDVELLDLPAAWDYLAAVRERVDEVVAERGADPELHEMVLQHEMQHTETMLQTIRLGDLAAWLRPLPAALTPREAADVGAPPPHGTGPTATPAGAGAAPFAPELVDVAGGPTTIGAGEDVFAYDNERPRHRLTLAPYRIARHPLSVATWDAFVADGGIRDARWWSDAGWAWRAGGANTDLGDATKGGPASGPGVTAGRKDATACHLNWFEAEAVAAWCGLRLPTEAEWEHAAGHGLLGGVGSVWEWTASEFRGYPGFRAHPYREYSEVFFDRGYRVLRGGSFAAHPRVATTTFRNWDLPDRRQIFAGVRLAGDAA